MRRSLVLAVAFLVVLAGCLGGGNDDDAGSQAPPGTEDDAGPGTGSSGGPGGDEGTQAEANGTAPQGPQQVTMYLTADGGVSFEEPTASESSAVPIPPFLPGFATGEFDLPVWISDGAPRDLTITEATITLYFTRDEPGRQDPQFPPFPVWWGQERGTQDIVFGEGPEMVQAGEVVEASFGLPIPPGGMGFREGETIQLKAAGLYHPSVAGQNSARFLVDSTETPMRLDLTFESMELAEALTEERVVDEAVTVQGSSCYGADAGEAIQALDLTVPADAQGIIVHTQRSSGQGQEDIDVDVLGPGGDVVAGGHTPTGDEWVRLYKPNIDAVGAGAWSIHVNACGPQAADIQVTADLLMPPA